VLSVKDEQKKDQTNMDKQDNGTFLESKFSMDCEEQFENLISNFFDILVLIDENGYQHYVSPSCEKILGYKPQELLGVSVIDRFIHPEDQQKTRQGLLNIIQNSENGGAQYRHKHKSGGWVYLEAFGTNQLDNPKVQSVVLNVRDITERKQTEQELMESRNRLSELNATKDRFFSIIGHDLKNPIDNIMGLSELMLTEIRAGNYDGVEEYSEMIHHSSKKANDLLSNLLTWARSQTGKIKYQPAQVELKVLADQTIDFLHNNAARKSITLENHIPDHIKVEADPVMMELILRNLLSNGIKFTPKGGTVKVGARWESESLLVFVKDTGVGIPEDDLEKLFRLEYNYSTKGTQKEAGTGLGLLLCKEFIGMHGGDIWVDSKVGEGSTFSFTIPNKP
jgi:PAS domain S-box-containing protein